MTRIAKDFHKKLSNSLYLILTGFVFSLLVACGGGGNGATGNGQDGDPVTPPGSGTLSNPAELAIETLYSGSVNIGESKYYKFTTGSRVLKHLVDLESLTGSVSWTMYSDSGYSSYVSSCYQSTNAGDCQTTSTLNSATTYYLKLQNLDTSTVSYTIRLDRIVSSEGSTSTPVQLTVGSQFEGTLGPKSGSSTVQSYYQFMTGGTDSTYTISLSGATTDVRWKLFAGDWNTGVRDCDDTWAVGNESCATVSLTANTTYNLAVETQGPNSTFVMIDINTGGTHVNSLSDEGSVGTPVTLTPGVAQSGTISPTGTSYYKFTTSSTTASYKLTLRHVTGLYDFRLYSDSGFTNQVDAQVNYSSSTAFLNVNWSTILLDPNATFYLKVQNFADLEDEYEIAITEDVPQDPDSEGTTITPIELTPGVIHSGSVGGWSSSNYTFTLPEAKPYQLSLTNGQTDIYWVAKTDFDTLSSVKVCGTVTGVGDEICQLPIQDAGTKLVMYVGNENETTPSTYDLLLTVIEGQGEGTQNTPVAVTKGTPYLSSLAANGSSYFQFTTGSEPESYRISVTGASTDTYWAIKKIGELNNLMTCDDYPSTTPTDMICETPVLEANTSYRVQVKNNEATATAFTLDVPTGDVVQPITLDSTLSGEVFDGYKKNGYYKFTTNSVDTSYTLQLSGSTNPAWIFFFPDATYDSYITLCNTNPAAGGNDISCTLRDLTPDTTYYLRVYLNKADGISDSVDVSVLADDYTETGVVLTLGADYAGKVASDEAYNATTYDGISYYQFTTAGGGPRVHDMTLTGVSEAYIRLYDDSGYTNQIDICYAASGSVACSTTSTLSANTTYYLAIDEIGGFSESFTLNVTSQ